MSSSVEVFLFSKKQYSLFEKFGAIDDDIKIKKQSESVQVDLLNCILESDANKYMIFCVKNMASVATSDTIYNLVMNVIKNDDEMNFDLFFLFHYLDRCDQYDDMRQYENFKIVNLYSPYGTECLLISPSGKEKILRHFHQKVDGNVDLYFNKITRDMKCYGTTPVLISTDITKRHHDHNVAMQSECREVPSNIISRQQKKNNNSLYGLFWFVVVLIIIILLAWVLISWSYEITTLNTTMKDFGFQPPYDPVGNNLVKYPSYY